MLLDGDSTDVESQDVNRFGNIEAVRPLDINCTVIEYGLSDESAVFDDIVGEAKQPADETELELQSIVLENADNQAENEPAAAVSLNALTHYSNLRPVNGRKELYHLIGLI